MKTKFHTSILIIGFIILVAIIWAAFQVVEKEREEVIKEEGMVVEEVVEEEEGEDEVIKIGAILPLTGPFADWGRTIKEGLELALQDVNNSFEVDYQDSVCEPQQTVTIANKMIKVDNIKIIVGPGCITGLKAIAPIAEKEGVLLFSTGLLDNEVFEKHQNVINFAGQIATEGMYLAKYLSEQNTIKSMAIVYGTNSFGQEHAKWLPIFLDKYGIETILTQPTDLRTKDFSTVIAKIEEIGPGAIFIHQAEIQIGVFMKQIREFNINIPVYGYYGVEARSVLDAGGDALEGIFYTYPVNNAEGLLARQNFEKKYAETFGADTIPSATSFFVYDGMVLLDEAVRVCDDNFSSLCIDKFFKGHGDYKGISGDMSFEEDGKVVRPFGIKKVENGEFIWVTKEVGL